MSAVLTLAGLGKDYGERRAVAAIDLVVKQGEILGVLGPNGAGKTTTMAMASGVLPMSRGTVTIGGIDLARDPFAAKRKLGLVPQELALYEELTAEHNLKYFGALYGLRGARLAEQIAWVLGVVGLSDRAHEPVKQFSGGMKRRLNLAAGLVHRPEVVILDEPTVGVDPQSRNHIFETIKQLRAEHGTTVVYTSHYMEEVEALCDRVAILDRGTIVAVGTVRELVATHAGAGDLSIETSDGVVHRVPPSDAIGAAISAIEATGVKVTKVSSRTANLETAFLTLTGHALRDGAA